MYLSKLELKQVMASYGYENFAKINHYEVGPDTWVYLFENNDKKYILIVTDCTGDYEFDVFPHLLKYESNNLEFVLQREIPIKNDSLLEKIHANTILFEYTD